MPTLGRGGNFSQLKSLLTTLQHSPHTHTPLAPAPDCFPLTYGRNSSKGTVSCFCLTRRYNFQEYSREMMRNRLRQPYTCQDMQEFREFCPFASTQAEKSGVIRRGTWQSFYYKSRFKYIIPSNLGWLVCGFFFYLSGLFLSSRALLKEE